MMLSDPILVRVLSDSFHGRFGKAIYSIHHLFMRVFACCRSGRQHSNRGHEEIRPL